MTNVRNDFPLFAKIINGAPLRTLNAFFYTIFLSFFLLPKDSDLDFYYS